MAMFVAMETLRFQPPLDQERNRSCLRESPPALVSTRLSDAPTMMMTTTTTTTTTPIVVSMQDKDGTNSGPRLRLRCVKVFDRCSQDCAELSIRVSEGRERRAGSCLGSRRRRCRSTQRSLPKHTLDVLLVLLCSFLLDAPLPWGRCAAPAVAAAAFGVVEPRRLLPLPRLARPSGQRVRCDRLSDAGRSRADCCRQCPATNQPWAEHNIRGRFFVSAAVPTRHDEEQQTEPSDLTAAAAEKKPPKAERRVNYVRPSAAIERGSGFFVPGLEGGKARLAMGIVLVALCLVQLQQLANLGETTNWTLAIASLYSGLVLVQSGIEFAQDSMRQDRSRRRTGTDNGEIAVIAELTGSCSWAGDDDAVRDMFAGSAAITDVDEYKDRVEWAASTYLSLTPATRMLLVHKDKVVFASQLLVLSTTTPPTPPPLPTRDTFVDAISKDFASLTASSDVVPGTRRMERRPDPEFVTEALACRAALATLEQSATGRVALPSGHPAFQFVASGIGDLGNAYEATAAEMSGTGGQQRGRTRTVILQKVSSHSCWAVASSDLLAAFTPQDLTWLGQLASYLPS